MQSDCLYSSLFFEHYNRILLCEWVLEHCSVCFIGVGADKFLGMRRIFAQISANLPEKNDLQKNDRVSLVTRHFWTIFAQTAPKLAQISPNSPENI